MSSDAARSARNGTLRDMRLPNSRRALGATLAALWPGLFLAGCASAPSARTAAASSAAGAPRVNSNAIPTVGTPPGAPRPSLGTTAAPGVYASPAALARSQVPPPAPSPAPTAIPVPVLRSTGGPAPVSAGPAGVPAGPAPAAPPPAAAPAAASSMPPAPTGPLPGPSTVATPVPSGPEHTSDAGDRNLKTSPIGQLAPEAVPVLPAPKPLPAPTPVTGR